METIQAGEFLMGSKQEEGRADERPQRKYISTHMKLTLMR